MNFHSEKEREFETLKFESFDAISYPIISEFFFLIDIRKKYFFCLMIRIERKASTNTLQYDISGTNHIIDTSQSIHIWN